MMTQGAHGTDPQAARLRLQGLEHLNRLQSGEATERDKFEFLVWRAESAAHEEAFRAAVLLQRFARETARTHGLPAANDMADDPSSAVVPLWRRPSAALGRRAFLGGAVAASAAGLYMVGRSLEMVPSPSELRADYRTPTGGRQLVRLAGGAVIDLNTRTSIALRQDLPMPAVELISGEAIVASGTGSDGRAALLAGEGRSVGRRARFAARWDEDDVCVTCLAGTVDVAWKEQRRELRPQEQVRYNAAGIGRVNVIDASVVTAWQTGTLIFSAMPMRKVVAEINRYRPGRVILANRALAERPLTGTYYVNSLDDFFSHAELVFGVHVRRLPGGVVILT
jgi:transmembrane sensor